MKRDIIKIDEDKCTGCGLCVPGCPEGALQIIDGKARLVSDLLCDGLGACIGECPEGAITIEQREAEPYDERKVMAAIAVQGANTIKAHLKHLADHGETGYLNQALAYLQENNISIPQYQEVITMEHHHTACPGSQARSFAAPAAAAEMAGSRPSQLQQWPVQMHLISPRMPHFQGADVLLAADCVAYTMGDFHKDYLDGKGLAIACPKLDDGQEMYLEKLKALIDEARINTLTVMIMEVPCCGGLLRLAQRAAEECERKVPIKCIVVGVQGEVLGESWV